MGKGFTLTWNQEPEHCFHPWAFSVGPTISWHAGFDFGASGNAPSPYPLVRACWCRLDSEVPVSRSLELV